MLWYGGGGQKMAKGLCVGAPGKGQQHRLAPPSQSACLWPRALVLPTTLSGPLTSWQSASGGWVFEGRFSRGGGGLHGVKGLPE